MMRKHLKSYRVKRKKSKFFKKILGFSILCFVAFIVFIYFFFFSPIFQVKKIEISGNKKIETQAIKNLIEGEIEKKFFSLSFKNIFLVNCSKTKEDILKNFPQIADVKTKKIFPEILSVEIKERMPVALFCQEKCFSVDEEGFLFEESSNKEGLIKIKSKETKNLNLGERILEKELITTILEIKKRIEKELKIEISEFLIVSQERINLKTIEGWQIYFNPQKDINWQITKLRVVLEKEIPPEKRGKLEYIELRFGNFASYKYRSN
jgi:cell division septal protein FtsQ